MIVGGVAIKAEDNRFTTYSLLSPRESKFKFDDYIGYLPLVTKYVMKVSKVKGRSSWGRMITSDLFAVGLMAGSVELYPGGRVSGQLQHGDGAGGQAFGKTQESDDRRRPGSEYLRMAWLRCEAVGGCFS